MNGRKMSLFALAAALVWPAVHSLTRTSPKSGKDTTLVSEPYRLDKIYRSMEGPMSVESGINLASGAETTPVQWITGLETQVVDATEQKPISPEYFCHANLTFGEHGATPGHYNQELGGKTHLDWRLFTLAPGRLSIELPKGFGVPIPADAPLDYVTMSLNLNERNREVNIRMKTKVHTVAGGLPDAPTKALFRRALYVLQPRGDSADAGPMCTSHSAEHVGAGCGEVFQVNLAETSSTKSSDQGLVNHWIVPQGHHVYRTEITPQMNLPFDTTIHYATIHVHPFARGMELRDLTTGAVILRLNSRDWPDRLGVAQVDEFKSTSGFPILRNHRYELTVEYDNTSGAKTDAMAILYLYLLEKNLG